LPTDPSSPVAPGEIERLERLVRTNPRVVSFPGPLPGLVPDGVHEIEVEAASAEDAHAAAREWPGAEARGALVRLRATAADLERASHPLLRDAAHALLGYVASEFSGPLPLRAGRPAIMGIVNVTPDSFSDGGRHLDPKAAEAAARAMIRAGAAIVDVGGESTRPGSEPVAEDVELHRVVPVVKALAGAGAALSVDTSKARVASEALAAGATIVNDVAALRSDERLGAAAARAGATVILMHMRGRPRDMQDAPAYEGDVVAEVARFLRRAILAAARAGIPEARTWVDPGFGFGKTRDHNYEILQRLHELRSLGRPIVVGTSRKSMLARPGGDAPAERLVATAASTAAAALAGAAVARVHDVAEIAEALRVASLVRGGR